MAHFMRLVFPPEEREKEQAQTTLATPHRASNSSFSSIPAVPAVDVDLAGLGSSRKKLFVGLGLGGLVLLGGIVAFALSGSDKPQPTVVPPLVVVKEPLPVEATVDAGLGAGAGAGAVATPTPDPNVNPGGDDVQPLPNLPVDPKPKDPKPKPVVAKGKLSLQTTPWSNVYFAKKNLGETPLVNVELPVGRHRLKLVNDEKKLETTIEVEIKANQTTSMKLKL
jgi:hypothetical protein